MGLIFYFLLEKIRNIYLTNESTNYEWICSQYHNATFQSKAKGISNIKSMNAIVVRLKRHGHPQKPLISVASIESWECYQTVVVLILNELAQIFDVGKPNISRTMKQRCALIKGVDSALSCMSYNPIE